MVHSKGQEEPDDCTTSGVHVVAPVVAVDPEDAEMLEDLVTSAFRDAFTKADEAHNEAMSGVTGGLGLPGLM